ncbi:FAD binding domain-containing protein [Novosphingobium terrae]|uniref:FAD binding domain-containing protein n=1 Tax=Novosphingobium terrae TaxID=2726189 RepID=UPI00197E3BC0|nr:FAD-dependent monooxygenase [Novosphingobium terrae]
MRIIISGGSVGGLFAGALLSLQGHDVQIFERSQRGLAGRGAGLVAQEDVFALLRRFGREDVTRTGVVAQARIFLDRMGAILSSHAHPQMQLSWDRLYLAMLDLIEPAAYHLGSSVVMAGSDEQRAWVELSDGSRQSADLVIGADGIGSSVRTAIVANQADTPRYAGYVAWRFLIPEQDLTSLSANALAGRFAFYHGDSTQVLGYLVAGPAGETDPGTRRYNCVWYRQVHDLPGLLIDSKGSAHPYSLAPGSVPDEVRTALLKDAHETLPPAFAQVMTREPKPFVQAIFDMTCTTMTADRLVLLGDAAFVARPHTAMGVAKAAGDAMALADLLQGHDLPQALQAYNAARTRAGRSIVAYGQRLGADMTPHATHPDFGRSL